jgi:uncharacterized protein
MTISPTVSVHGQSTIRAEPELATLTISIDAQASGRQETLDLLSRRTKAVADLVARHRAGIERVETSRLHVYPELDGKKTEKVRRYIGRATTTLLVHDFAVISDLVVGCGGIDLVTVDGPWWQLRPDSDVYRRARLAAAGDALERARDYAAAFGAELVGLVEIADHGMSHSESAGVRAPGWVHQSMARAVAEDTSFDLEPGQQEVTGQVEARFLLTQPDLSTSRTARED